ncbi:MAG: hypothetical protein ACM3KE_21265 [Hyphomicrobiales bacterium]
MNSNYSENEDVLIIEELQCFLQEKRTALKAIRMGIAIILAQASAVGFLVTTFRNHALIQALRWIDILVVLGVILAATAIYLVVGPLIRIRRINRKISQFKQKRTQSVNPRGDELKTT